MSDPIAIQAGTVFAGDFRVVRPLSAGGMGAVYAAEQLSTGKPRALKVMLPQLVADATLRKRFEQEARIGSRIESEHVVEVVGAGVDAALGLPWLAMELLTGDDLSQVVTTRGALPVTETLVLFEQLCHAVGAAHRVGVVHRDLKPENIFLAQSKRAGSSFMVKVLDFGIAKVVAEASTKQTAAMGSPIWMAPEQADQSPITPATDVWALGLIAFFLLTGKPFWKSANFDEATIPQILKEILFEPIGPASARAAEMGPPHAQLPQAFDGWFARCVARDPAARFPDATQAGAALAAALGAEPLSFAATAMPDAGTPMTVPGQPSAPIVNTAPAPFRAMPSSRPSPPVAGAYGTGAAGSFAIPQAEVPRRRVPTGVAVAVVLGAVLVGSSAAGGVWWLTRRPPVHATASDTATPSATPPSVKKLVPLPVAADAPTFTDAAAKALPSLLEDAPTKPTSPTAAPGPATPSKQVPTTTNTTFNAPSNPSTVVTPPPTPPPAPSPPPAPPPRSVYDLATSVSSADWQAARNILEPKVQNGTATVDEVRLLERVCKDQHDSKCVAYARRSLSRRR